MASKSRGEKDESQPSAHSVHKAAAAAESFPCNAVHLKPNLTKQDGKPNKLYYVNLSIA